MTQPERPNVVVVMSDQHNARIMGCAGDEMVQTPNLDRLAAAGVRFTNTYCPYPLCLPSRMAFMAAQYPSAIGVYDNGSVLSSQVPTFAHALGAAGYEAVLCGRMHFAGPDQFHGFERRIFGDVSGALLSEEILGTGKYRTNGQTAYAVEVAGHGRTGYGYYDEVVTDRACDFLRTRSTDLGPFCLVVGLILPHNPLICEPELFNHYLDRLPEPGRVSQDYLDALHPAIRAWRGRRGVDRLTPSQNHRGLAAYYGLVTQLDRSVGRILDAVDSSPHARNTAVIYCSDHGDMACQHGMWWKSSFYDGSAGVPLMFSWPGRCPEGVVREAEVSLIDVGPTVLQMTGAEPLPDASGTGLLGCLSDEDSPHPHPDGVLCEYSGLLGDGPGCMIRRGPWKLNSYHGYDDCQLFNLEQDPTETHDRAADPSCQAVLRDLLGALNAQWSANRVLEGVKRQERSADLIRRSGHAVVPHELPSFTPPEEINRFDFSQLE